VNTPAFAGHNLHPGLTRCTTHFLFLMLTPILLSPPWFWFFDHSRSRDPMFAVLDVYFNVTAIQRPNRRNHNAVKTQLAHDRLSRR
jgi:hypothetical protein